MSAPESSTPNARQMWLVPEEGPTGHHTVAEVACDVPSSRVLTYAVPAELEGVVGPGSGVQVPYGRGQRVAAGVCLRLSRAPWDHTRKPIRTATPPPTWVTERLIELGLWISDYYACSPWKTFAALMPRELRKLRTVRVPVVRATGVEMTGRLTAQQAAVLQALAGGERPRADVLATADVKAGVLLGLRKRGLIEIELRRVPVEPEDVGTAAGPAVEASAEDDYALTSGQRAALERIQSAAAGDGVFRVLLLFGVPGSGKTEVYVRAARDVIARGRQVILLIPEIALTTQLIDRLRRRFTRVAVLHSQLTTRTRVETLAAVARGEVDVVIGTRTAVFAPCPRPGLIIVDEEQEGSFKNLGAPFYHARDVAIKRGQIEQIPVVLGSATPALESWHNAQSRKHYELVRLPDRVPGARLPTTRLVLTGEVEGESGATVVSPALRAELEQTLAAGQQAILLHNRRGYAVFLRCTRCGMMISCETCGSHLVYHRVENTMKCHRCGRKAAVPEVCRDDTCRGRLERTGSAIQQLEDELTRTFPAARLLRLDSDTMRKRESYRAALECFERGEADILLGTQMVAKGLDFPGVRLVGVIEADAALSMPDFRAGERVLQLVEQVVGRAGRREGASLALVQSTRDVPLLRDALRMDYEAFAERELVVRKRWHQPPWTRLVRLVCSDARPQRARQAAEELSRTLRECAGRVHAGLRVEAAEPCVITRLRNMLRVQVLVRGPRGMAVQQLLHEAGEAGLLRPRVQRFTIDVDPVDLL